MLKKMLITIGLGISLIGQAYADISGTVYRDFNGNGVQDNSDAFKEIGIANVTVTAYGINTAIGSAVTAADGTYTISTNTTGPIRLNFMTLPKGYYPTTVSRTSLQFLTAPVSDANLGLNHPADYVGNPDPMVAVTHQVGGNPLATNTSGDYSSPENPVVTIFNYSNRNYKLDSNWVVTSELADGANRLVANKQTGTLFGEAYAPYSKKLFAAAFLKRHSGLGIAGSGGIYMIDPSGTFPNAPVTPFADLDSLGIATHHPDTANALHIKTNDERGLPANYPDPDNDTSAFAQVGRVSLGDLDISDNGRYLFVTNLYNKSVVKIDLQDARNPIPPTAAQVQELAITPPTCVNGEFRPFALKYYRDELYIGSVCDASTSNNADDISFHVIKLNPINGTNNVVFSFGAYTKAQVYGPSSKWAAWFNDWQSNQTPIQPLFTDLEIDVDGSFIMGFADRNGHQRGYDNYQPYNNEKTEQTTIAGDILRASYDPTSKTYTLEDNGTVGTLTSAGVNNGQGPNNGEFYIGDGQKVPKDSTTPEDDAHKERSQGGLALLPGSTKIIMGTMNPKGIPWTSGVAWLSNITGENTQELFITKTLGKANGMGDIEILSELPPIEIGNRVWIDTNKDGLQNTDEPGVENITVTLMQGTSEIAKAVTAADGSYVFSSAAGTSTASYIYGLSTLVPNTAYTLKFPTTITVNNVTYQLTTPSIGSHDQIDSNPVVATGEAAVTASSILLAGANNYGFDAGYVTPPAIDLELSKTVNNANPKKGDIIEYTLTLTNKGPDLATNVEITDALPPQLTYQAPFIASRGTYNANKWSIIALEKDGVATLKLNVLVN